MRLSQSITTTIDTGAVTQARKKILSAEAAALRDGQNISIQESFAAADDLTDALTVGRAAINSWQLLFLPGMKRVLVCTYGEWLRYRSSGNSAAS